MSCTYDIPVVTIMSAEALLSPLLYAEAYALMPDCRIRKTDRFRQEKDKRLSVAAGLLLRKAAVDAGMDPDVLKHLEEGEHGKPFCPGLPFHFNLSHSGNLAVCAVSREEIGVDVETARALSEAVKKRVFTESERVFLRSPAAGICFGTAPGDASEVEFRKEREDAAGICLWTVKESYLKMKGAGITVDPIRVETVPDVCEDNHTTEGTCQYFSIVCRNWPGGTAHAVTVWHEGVPVSVCTEAHLPVPVIRRVIPEECMPAGS